MTLKQTLVTGALVGAGATLGMAGINALSPNTASGQTGGVVLQSNTVQMDRGCFSQMGDGGYAFIVHLPLIMLLPDGGMEIHDRNVGNIEVGNPPLLQAINTAAQNRLPY